MATLAANFSKTDKYASRISQKPTIGGRFYGFEMLYFDANATASLRPSAKEVVEWYVKNEAAVKNASSVHQFGRAARALLGDAREKILRFLGAGERLEAELVFTSGGTESASSLMHGFLGDTTLAKGEIVTSSIEHACILEPLKLLEQRGWNVIRVKPAANGIVSAEEMVAAISRSTSMVVLMAANNESGALQPIIEVAQLARAKGFGGPIISDTAQAIQKSDIDVSRLFAAGVSGVSLSGHKLGALGGIGCMIIAKNGHQPCLPFTPMLVGGPQEQRFRAGTENLLGAISLGAVSVALLEHGQEERNRLARLRDEFWRGLSHIPGVYRLTPDSELALSNTLFVAVENIRGDDLVVGLDLKGLAASTGSACSSGKQDSSYVAKEMGVAPELLKNVIRLSLDWSATEEDISSGIAFLTDVITTMRASTNENAAGVCR